MWDKENGIKNEELKFALRHAILTEKSAMDFYRYAADRMTDERARLTFQIFASEELEHARSFYKAYPGDDLEPFDELMDAPPDTASEWWQALERIRLSGFDERLALILAIEREGSLEENLFAIAERVLDPRVREVFLRNAKMTHRHRKVVEGDFEALTGEAPG